MTERQPTESSASPAPRAETSPVDPFPGLRPFEAQDSKFFYGRENQVTELLKRLGQFRFLSIVGASGAGKSSLVRAGLLPALGLVKSPGLRWRTTVLRPGEDPLEALAEALVKLTPAAASPNDASVASPLPMAEQVAMLEATLRRSSLGLVDTVRQLKVTGIQAETNEPAANLLIVVDQFEELFRFRTAWAENANYLEDATAFVKLLLHASTQRDVPIYVVLTMRTDFIGDCTLFQDLPEAMNNGQFLVPRLTRDQLALAVRGPVELAGAAIDPNLVQKILNDMEGLQDELPVLQHALMRTWQHWRRVGDDKAISFEHYDAVGGLQGALDRHAESVFLDALSEPQQKIAEAMFRRLTLGGERGRAVRAPAALREVAEVAGASIDEVSAVVDVFRAGECRFLMPPPEAELKPHVVVDLTHEALMRTWNRLTTWVVDEYRAASMFRRLAEAAELHARREQDFWRDPQLGLMRLQWEEQRPSSAWALRYHPAFELAQSFLQASVEADARTKTEAEAARHEAEATRVKLLQEKARADREHLRATLESRQKRAAWGALCVVGGLLLGVFVLWRQVATTNAQLRARDQQVSDQMIVIESQTKDIADKQKEISTQQLLIAKGTSELEAKGAALAQEQKNVERQQAELKEANELLTKTDRERAAVVVQLRGSNARLSVEKAAAERARSEAVESLTQLQSRNAQMTADLTMCAITQAKLKSCEAASDAPSRSLPSNLPSPGF